MSTSNINASTRSPGDGLKDIAAELPKRDVYFWLTFISLAMSVFVVALELIGVPIALPVIANDLHSSQFLWVGSAYALSSTAFVPMSGGFAQVFGRRIAIIGSLILFAVGSALCGAAPSMNFLICGRVIQGLGGGGLSTLTHIIVSDLVPLKERGLFYGLIGLAWAAAAAVSPIIAGELAQNGKWRWFFYLCIPIPLVAATLAFFVLRLKVPPGSVRDKIGQMDWIGNFLVITCSSACIISLTWGGIQYSWTSPHVLVPLVSGLLGLILFIFYEAKVAKYPIIPFALMTSATTISGYIQTFVFSTVLLALLYTLPVYFQACQLASPVSSGVDVSNIAISLVVMGMISGASVAKFHQYCPQLYLSWTFVLIGLGLFTTIHADTPRGTVIGFGIILGTGVGIQTTTTTFPILAPLPVSANAKALAFYIFTRNFAQVWGIAISGSVLQNGLVHKLPRQFLAVFDKGADIAYSIIPLIPTIEEPLKTEVQNAFSESAVEVVYVSLAVGALGMMSSWVMKRLPLHTDVDDDWGLARPQNIQDIEAVSDKP